MRKLNFVSTILAVLTSFSARATTLDEAIRTYLERSPQIQAQSQISSLTRGDRWRRFLPHEPQAQLLNADDSSQISYGLSVTTSFPGKAFAYAEADRVRADGETAELRAKKHELARLVATQYLDCATGRAKVSLQEQAVEDFSTLAHSLQSLYETGHSTQAEKIGAELQYRQAVADLDAARSHAESSCRKWKELMGEKVSSVDPEGLPDDLAAETLEVLGSETADQGRAQAAAKTALTNRSLRWWAQAPDITWGVSRNHYVYSPASPAGRDWTTSFTVGVTLPLFFLFDEAATAKRQAAEAEIAKDAAEIQLISANTDREAAAREFTRTRKRLQELRDRDLPLAEALNESTLAAYRNGKLGFSELILSRKTRIDLKTQEIQLKGVVIDARLRCLAECQGETETRKTP